LRTGRDGTPLTAALQVRTVGLNSCITDADDCQTVSQPNFNAASVDSWNLDSPLAFMNPATIGTAAGTAAVTVGRGVLGAAGGGLSFLAELAKATAGSVTQPAQETTTTKLDAVADLVTALQNRIKEHLAAAGIRLTSPVELASNGAGGIAVLGPHPQQAAIEDSLASDLLLERDFHELATRSATGTSPFTLTIRP